MTTYYRWLILPMATFSDDEIGEYRAPKYVETESRLDAYDYSAGPFSRQDLSDAGYDHLLAYNDADSWRVVLAWGTGDDGWQALNEIHANHHDTETLADHGQDVEPVLDQRFGNHDWTLDDKVPVNGQNTS